MKMNYLLNRSFRAGKKPATRFRVFFVVFFLLLAFFFWRPELVRAPLSAVAAPLWRTGNALGNRIGRIAQFMQSKRTLVAEIGALRQKAAERDALYAGYALAQAENRELKQFLGRKESESRTLAAVLVSPPRAPYDSFVLDAGTDAGVAKGDEILFGNTVLGRVVAVARETATGRLFSTAGVLTPVVIWRKDRAVPAEAVGEGNGAFRITIPKETGITAGDVVVMPGINPTQFGEVAVVLAGETDSFAVAFVRNPVNVATLRFLEIRAGKNPL